MNKLGIALQFCFKPLWFPEISHSENRVEMRDKDT